MMFPAGNNVPWPVMLCITGPNQNRVFYDTLTSTIFNRSEITMLINISNHASSKWNEKQLAAASEYGEIKDIPFPAIDPFGSSEYMDNLGQEYYNRILEFADPVVMLQGEFVFTFRLANWQKRRELK